MALVQFSEISYVGPHHRLGLGLYEAEVLFQHALDNVGVLVVSNDIDQLVECEQIFKGHLLSIQQNFLVGYARAPVYLACLDHFYNFPVLSHYALLGLQPSG